MWITENDFSVVESYVKITLMYDGRPMKKTKTSAKGTEPNPAFNETFVFDVPAYQLDKVYIGLAIIAVEKVGFFGYWDGTTRQTAGRYYLRVTFKDL